MKAIYLYGRLAELYAPCYKMEVRDPAEAIRALVSQLDGFESALKEGDWYIVRGKLEDDIKLDEESLTLDIGQANEIHIMPAVAGAGGDTGKILVGALMVGAAFFTGGASIAAWSMGQTALGAMGAGLIAGGVTTMLAQTPSTGAYDENSKPDERASTLFNGPVNRSTQGVAIPLIYGEVITGSIVISSGITTEKVDVE